MSLPECVAKVVDSTSARVGLSVIQVEGGPGFGINENETFAQASAIKIPILWTLHRAATRGELSLDEAVPIDPTNGAGGCGVLQQFTSPATQIALGDLAVLIIVLSDNVATNLLIDRIGFDAVNALIEDLHGSERTRLRRKMIDPAARRAGQENTATPADAATLMLRLAEGAKAGDPAAKRVLQILSMKKASPVTEALGSCVRLATKPGMLDGIRTEWSIIESNENDRLHHYSMALMADGADDTVMQTLFRNLATAIHKHLIGGS